MSGSVIEMVEGGVATVTLNRPDRLNALNRDLADRLSDVLGRLAEMSSVRSIILRGASNMFSAGGDVGDLAAGTMFPSDSSYEEKVDLLRRQMRSSELLATMPKLTIAAVDGPCIGAGLGLAAACDLRYCTPQAVFSTAFLTVGLSGDYGGTWTISRALGAAKARELFLLSPKFDAQTAERLGFVNGIVPREELDQLVAEKAKVASRFDQAAFARTKQNLNNALAMDFGQALDCEAKNQISCLDGEAVKSAAAAFLERGKTTSR